MNRFLDRLRAPSHSEADHTAQIEALQQQVHSLQTIAQQTQQTADQKTNELAEFQAKVDKWKTRVKEIADKESREKALLAEEVAVLKQTLSNDNPDAASLVSVVANLRQEKSDLLRTVDQLRESLNQATANNTAAEQRTTSFLADVEKLTAENVALKRHIAEWTTTREQHNEEQRSFKQTIADLEQLSMAQAERAKSFQGAFEAQEAQVAAARRAADTARQENDVLKSDVERLTNALDSAQATAAAAMRQLNGTTPTSEDGLGGQIDMLKNSLAETNAALEAEHNKYLQLEGRTAAWKEKVKAAKLEDLATIDRLRNELAAAISTTTSTSETTTDVSHSNERIAALERELSEARAAAAAQEEKTAAWKEKVKQSKADDLAKIAALTEELAAVKAQLEGEAAAQVSEAVAAREALERELSEARAAAAAQEEKTAAWKEKVKQSKADDLAKIAALTEELAAVKAQLEGEAAAQVSEAVAAREALERELSEARRFEAVREADRHRALSERLVLESRIAELEASLASRGNGSLAVAAQMAAREMQSLPPSVRAATNGDSNLLLMAQLSAARDSEVAHLRSLVADLESAASKHQTVEDDLQSRLTSLTKQLEALKLEARRDGNLEYAKNVVVQFLLTQLDDARMRMLPALATVLQFTARDRSDVQRVYPHCPRLS